MKSYVFKIQWVFNNNQGDVLNCINVIKAIGVKSLDVINFRDRDFKLIENYNGFIMYDRATAEEKTIECINQAILNNKVTIIEILKR